MKSKSLLALIVCINALVLTGTRAEEPVEPLEPLIAGESEEGRRAMARFRLPEGMKVELFAAEPLLANPVAFTFDEQGRLFVCETFRQGQGVTDNRDHDQRWLDADLAAQTVADRLEYHKRLLGEKVHEYSLHDDRVRLIEDTNGDGVADHSTVFADHFNQIVEGSGAGVLARRGNVYFTCIPNLWLLRDENNDGNADVRTALHTGYGVRVAFRGHDLHGLCIGPDGKLYFSVGDRGYHIELPDRTLADPESGAVFRCNLDGSDLEVFATGLRNPQELAFDEFGNLFTGDNNSDSGDRARWVYVVEGGDSGWRMAYQYLRDRGPFNSEKIWHPFHEGQPAYIVPPVANVADGPSGLAYYPGAGLDDRFRGCFFLCDFRGTPNNSGVRTIKVEPRGAFFEVIENKEAIWGILATDVEFAPDGNVYVSDWVNGWNGEGKGRIYRFSLARPSNDARGAELRELLRSGFTERPTEELQQLLAHNHARVRLEAQLALAERGASDALSQAAQQSDSLLARLHGIWGLGQLLAAGSNEELITTVTTLLKDSQAEVRAQAARVLGDARAPVASSLVPLLRDDELRVRHFAAHALGKIGAREAFEPIVQMLVENADRDPIVRHGGIMGLVGINDERRLEALATHPAQAARIAAVVALRKLRSPLVAIYLKDADVSIQTEAARAIHDVPITEAMGALAELANSAPADEALLRRVLNANFRLGGVEHADAIARLASRANMSESLRREAIGMLATWADPPSRDRVLGMWRPLAARDAAPARTALQKTLPVVLANSSERVQSIALDAAAKLGIGDAAPLLKDVFNQANASGALRATALAALASIEDPQVRELAVNGLRDSQTEVRIAARRALARLAPAEAVGSLREAVQSPDLQERQDALSTLADMEHGEADQVITECLQRLLDDQLPADTRLDTLEAARTRRENNEIARLLDEYQGRVDSQNPLAAYQETLYGGNAERGRQIFFERTEVSCLRCHTVGNTGGEVGPELTKIAEKKDRRYLLESIVEPSKTIAENFQSAIVIDDRGRVLTGIVKQEDDEQLQLLTAEGAMLNIPKDSIDERSEGPSAMPQDLVKHLSQRDVRDLVEWLSTLK